MRRTVLLAASDPHPRNGSHLVSEWWGRQIEIEAAQRPKYPKVCGTSFIWKITGPPEFLILLRKHGLGEYVCEHQIQTATFSYSDAERAAVYA